MNFTIFIGIVIGLTLEGIFMAIVGEDIAFSFFGYIVGAILIFGPIAGLSHLYKKGLYSDADNQTTEELIDEYNTYVKTVRGLSGGYDSKLVANHYQNEIEEAQLKGEAVAQALAKRGYKVDTSALQGSAGKSTPHSGRRSVIKDAAVGGIIAGAPGAIIGAIHAADKNNQGKN